MFYNSYFMRRFTSTWFMLAYFIKYVLCDIFSVYDMLVNVNGIYYVMYVNKRVELAQWGIAP